MRLPSIHKAKLRLIDELRHSRQARDSLCLMHWGRASLAKAPDQQLEHYCRALEFSQSAATWNHVLRSLRKGGFFESGYKIWDQIVRRRPQFAIASQQPKLSRSVILKAPLPGGEKGVLLMTFEYNHARLLLHLSGQELAWLDKHFHIILSTSWSPTDYAVLGLACAKLEGPIFVQSCNYSEIKGIESFHPKLRCLKSLPCDWIDPAFYPVETDAERPTDIVMVANWGEFKRHWDLFQALTRMPPSLKIVLIGQKDGGRTRDTVRALARQMGVPQQLEIHESVPISEVSAHQMKAKVSVIMSRREGCCVAAVESLFAGCALAMRADAHVGPLTYINEQTGLRLRPSHIADDLMTLLERSPSLRPREWALANISCQVTGVKLNDLLRQQADASGLPWTQDIAIPHWRPHPKLSSREDEARLAAVYQDLHERYPNVFPSNLLNEGYR